MDTNALTNKGNDVDVGADEHPALEDVAVDEPDADVSINIEEFENLLDIDDEAPAPDAAAGSKDHLDMSGPEVDAFNHVCWARCRDESWGPFTSWVWRPAAAARPCGGIEVTCPFHKRNTTSGCKKQVSLRSRTQSEFDVAVWALRHWCNSAQHYDRQRYHILPRVLNVDLTPAHAIVTANKIENGPPGEVKGDDKLDAEDAAAEAARLHARGGGRGAGGRAHRACRRQRGRGRGRARPEGDADVVETVLNVNVDTAGRTPSASSRKRSRSGSSSSSTSSSRSRSGSSSSSSSRSRSGSSSSSSS